MNDDLALALLAEARKQTALLERIADRSRPPRRRDLAAASALLPALAEHFGTAAFGAGEAIGLAAVSLPTRALLRAALLAAVGDLDATAGRRLGHLLRRLAQSGADCAGWRIERVGDDAGAALWVLRAVKPTETQPDD